MELRRLLDRVGIRLLQIIARADQRFIQGEHAELSA